jgi:hypothetical protein
MAKPSFREFLAATSLAEQANIILAFRDWMIADFAFAVDQGVETMPEGGLESLRHLDPGFEARLRKAVSENDRQGLKIGVMELFRLLPAMQKEPSGARLNLFLSRRLPEGVFRQMYEAAGLNSEAISYDERILPFL